MNLAAIGAAADDDSQYAVTVVVLDVVLFDNLIFVETEGAFSVLCHDQNSVCCVYVFPLIVSMPRHSFLNRSSAALKYSGSISQPQKLRPSL